MLPSARQSLLRSRPTGARSTRTSSPPSGRPSRSPRSWRMGDPSLRPRLPPTTQVRQSDQVKVTHPNVPGWSDWLLSSLSVDYVQCPYCQRRFNENAADRHIKFCQEQAARMPNKGKLGDAKKTPARSQVLTCWSEILLWSTGCAALFFVYPLFIPTAVKSYVLLEHFCTFFFFNHFGMTLNRNSCFLLYLWIPVTFDSDTLLSNPLMDKNKNTRTTNCC